MLDRAGAITVAVGELPQHPTISSFNEAEA
jgi:hypothetical protein